jgi:hypothetical protein
MPDAAVLGIRGASDRSPAVQASLRRARWERLRFANSVSVLMREDGPEVIDSQDRYSTWLIPAYAPRGIAVQSCQSHKGKVVLLDAPVNASDVVRAGRL